MSELEALKSELKANGFKVRVLALGWEYTSPDGAQFMNRRESDSIQEAHKYMQYKKEMEKKVSEVELLYKFFADYPETGVIMKDGMLYAVTGVEGDVAQANERNLSFWYNGDTIGDAIRQLYDELEKEKGNASA